MKKKYIFFTYYNKNKIYEGGIARDFAIYNYLINNYKNNIRIMHLKDNKFINIIKNYSLIFFENKIIILQYPRIGLPIFNKNILCKIITYIFLNILKFTDKRNNITIDISDLPYEQSIDLELKLINKEMANCFESKIFNLKNAKFVFASYSMRDYICKKYNLMKNRTYVCVNGGHKIDIFDNYNFNNYIKSDRINCIYAGTLNKGRQIENVLNIFSNKSNINLLLIGAGGEWINNYKLSSNILYLGRLNENKAHFLISLCDIGLIPYDNNKFYYNIAYPTKLSFYITAGITFLSTPVKEVININKKYNIGYTFNIEEWGPFLDKINKSQINIKNMRIKEIMNEFYWNNILSKINKI